MANHLTPAELADDLAVPRTTVIANCVRMGVPVHHRRIDRTLYVAAVQADREGRTTAGTQEAAPVAEHR